MHIVLGLAALLAGGCRREAGGNAVERRIGVAVQVARLEQVEEHRRLSGDVTPWSVLPLSFKVGGRVTALRVEEGERVRAGQLVALLDSRDYKLVRDLAETQVRALTPHLSRAERLRGEAALPQAKLDELQSKMEAARIRHEQAKAQLSYASLRAPMEAVVLMRRVAVGDMVDPSRPVVVLADLSRVRVVLPVPQRDLGLFRRGMQVVLSAAGLARDVGGTVDHIAYASDPKTRTFAVTVVAANPDLALRAGMIVEARVLVTRHRGIFVPLDAITRDIAGRPAALVVVGQRAESRALELGLTLGDRVQVVSGIGLGDRVVVRGLVGAGDLVTVRAESER